VDGLGACAAAGVWEAAERLPGVLQEQRRAVESERLRRFGLAVNGSIART
jgi:hypothetical protein